MTRKNVLILTFIALGLRLFLLINAPLWYDESFTAWVSAQPFGAMIDALKGDTHPPLYYLITWLMLRISGTNPIRMAFWLRLPSVVFSAAAVYLTWMISQSLRWPKRAEIAALAMMTISPFQVFYAQEARMYAFMQFWILLAFWAILDRRWMLATVSMIALVYTQNYGLFYMVALGLAALYRDRAALYKSGTWLRLGLVFGIPVLAWLPWAWVMFYQMSIIEGGYWITPPTAGAVISAVYMVLFGLAQAEPIHILTVVGAVALLILSFLRLIQKRPQGAVPLAILGAVPVILPVIVSWVWSPIFLYRGLIAAAPALYLIIGWWWGRISKPVLRWYAVTLVAPVMLVGLINYYAHNPKGGTDRLLGVANAIRAEYQEGDIIYHVDAGSMVGWWTYGDKVIPQYKAPLPPTCQPGEETLGGLSAHTRRALGIREIPLDEIQHNRAFVVWGQGPTSRSCWADYYAHLIDGEPFHLSEDSKYVLSGVWLYE